jgi:hypothetical protein
VCIQTALDNTNYTLFNINGMSRSSTNKLNEFLGKIVRPESTLISDGDTSYDEFCLSHDLIHEIVDAKTGYSRNSKTLGKINNLLTLQKFH